MPSDRRRFLTLCTAAAASSAALAGCSLPTSTPSTATDGERVDDWQYSPEREDDDNGLWSFGGSDDAAGGNGVEMATSTDESIGLAAGGAADVGTLRRNVAEGYLPLPESVATEGLFHEYYFDTGGDGSCGSLFCPTYTPAVAPDPLSGEPERYLSVGLESGLAQSEFERPALNLVVVLDISGSMRASFDDYYYDQFGNRHEAEGDTSRPKIDVAKEALAAMTRQLRPDDRLGVVLFNGEAHLAKPLREVDRTDMDAIREHMREDVEARGGTNVSAGLELSEELVAEYDDADREAYENRTILITDAQINVGETDADELQASLEANADRDHHTTVVGVGVDFNAELIDRLTAVRGANYYSVHSADEFERRVTEEFEYMVSPLVYDLSLELAADGYEIVRVYGSTAADSATGELMRVNTLFPSARTDGEAKGGVVLVQVARTDAGDADSADATLTLEASWETRSGERRSTTETVAFPSGDDERYGSSAVRKAILLARYADLLRNWTIHEREGDLVAVDGADDGIAPAPDPEADRLGEWELQSDPLTVSPPYDERLERFRDHLRSEREAIGDEALERERELLDEILASG
ncbi:vWA domain-containing protein [Halopiger xanaduensis]|uniref:von Willebrand factor type A n=1 Tax=Halopiger xanaduensis (strain DSM 18323 / JCM 14033 / SH-6) TaxID=797210 RepID=F8DAS5_HALXS|nr:VWA domain-containing protein [Halopiger xanaduensis]AEH37017.1 von Willebrand factor type A [Halopiger xanaduensis SH-6]